MQVSVTLCIHIHNVVQWGSIYKLCNIVQWGFSLAIALHSELVTAMLKLKYSTVTVSHGWKHVWLAGLLSQTWLIGHGTCSWIHQYSQTHPGNRKKQNKHSKLFHPVFKALPKQDDACSTGTCFMYGRWQLHDQNFIPIDSHKGRWLKMERTPGICWWY